MSTPINYLHGFGNHFKTEALANTLVIGRNSPQKVPHGLYAEQINGSAFTAPRHHNLSSWLYRMQPSVTHGEFELVTYGIDLDTIPIFRSNSIAQCPVRNGIPLIFVIIKDPKV